MSLFFIHFFEKYKIDYGNIPFKENGKVLEIPQFISCNIYSAEGNNKYAANFHCAGVFLAFVLLLFLGWLRKFLMRILCSRKSRLSSRDIFITT